MQSLNTPRPMPVTLSGRATDFSAVHPSNMDSPTVVTPSASVTVSSAVQPAKREEPVPLESKAARISTLSRFSQSRKALLSRLATDAGMVTSVRPVPSKAE